MAKQYSSFSDVSDEENSITSPTICDEDFLLGGDRDDQELNVVAVANMNSTNGVSIEKISPRKNTKKTTNYGRRAFCDWWDAEKQSFQFDEHKFPRQDFRDMLRKLDGVALWNCEGSSEKLFNA